MVWNFLRRGSFGGYVMDLVLIYGGIIGYLGGMA